MTHLRYTFLFAAALTAASTAKADYFWSGGTGDWNDPLNWGPDTGPNFNGDRFVNNGGTAIIPAGGSTIAPIRDIKVAGGGGTTGTVNNAAGVHTANGWAFIGLDGGTGIYNLADTSGSGGTYTGMGMGSGSIAAGRLYVGLAGGGNGTLNVNTSATNSYEFIAVGDGATGTLNLDNGTLSTTGEMWFGQGGAGNATVNQSGGTISSSNWLAIGRDFSTGVYNLSGGTLAHTGANHTIIGSLSGKGTLNQSGGSFTEVNDLRLGENGGGQGTYNHTGGTATVNGWTVVGWTGSGTGTLNVGGGAGTATFSSGYVEVGGGAGGSGNGTVNLLTNGVIASRIISRNGGAISAQVNFNGGTFRATESNGEFLPGFNSTNTEVQAGGLIVDTNGFNIATSVGLDGAGGLTKTGAGTLTLNGISTYTGMTVISQGTLVLGPGASLNPSSIVDVAASAAFDGSAAGGVVIPVGQTLRGNGSTIGNTTVNGTIAPGNSIGTLTIAGDLTLAGVTSIELDPSLGQNSDEINITAPGTTVTYGGTLNVTQIGGTFALGQTFDIFDAGTFSGSFGTTNLPSLTGLGDGNWYWANNLGTVGSIQILPEPTSSAFAALAGLGFLARRRRK
jgi:autotransporter-associated beta strand protein